MNDKVIVLFKNQLSALPDTATTRTRRDAAIASIQRPVISQLRMSHAQNIRTYQVINGLAATVSPAEAARLAADPAVAKVLPDEQIRLASPLPGRTPGSRSTVRSSGQTPLPGACAPKGQVQLDPQAIEQIHAATQSGKGPSAQGLGYTGAGVKVGFIADGVDPNNQDFIRSNGQHVFADYQDFSNTGSNGPTSGGEAFLDSSSIAAQGLHTYNVAGYGVGLNRACNIRILGVAPGASLVGLDVFGSLNEAFNSVFVEAINYAVNVDHVNVLNESFGDNPFPDAGSLDLVRMADDAAVAAGTTVTVSTGDAGDSNTIGSPSTDPNLISAGATTTYRAYAQTGIGGIFAPGVKGWLNNNISGLSSAGFAQNGQTLDVVAPGDLNWTLCTPKPKLFAACTNFAGKAAPVDLSGGTSEAAPLTAGVAALVIQAYAKAHGGKDPSPAVVKQIITSTAEDVGAPAEQQGNGMLDAYQAVLAAKSWPGTSGASGGAIVQSSNQLHASGFPGTLQKLNDKITNDGSKTVTVGVSSRTLGTYTSVRNTKVTLSDSTGNAATVGFTVPKGQARLQGMIAFKAPGPAGDGAARVNLSLIDPNGDLAEYNLPQGAGNFSIAQVANPLPGKWTALISSAPSAAGGTTGTVLFGAQVAAWKVFGTLSAHSLTLAPGASKQITLSADTPAAPGDKAAAIVLTSHASEPSFAKTTTIAVTLRSLVPVPSPSTTFTGTLNGGNGRQQSEGQAAFYQVKIPSGLPELNAQITMANSSNPFVAMLVDPSTHQAASTAANSLLGIGAGGGFVPEPQDGAELHVLHPSAGLWTLIIGFYGQVAGTTLSQPFTVKLNTALGGASVRGLPDSAATRLAPGTPKTVSIHIRNTGKVPEEYFVDGRLTSSTTYPLPSQTNGTVQVPITGTPPEYFVPSHTTAITAAATAAKPVYFDFWSYFGDPDLFSSTGTTATGTFKSPSVTNGLWVVSPFQKGPDGTTALPPVTTTTSMTATARAFDPSVSSPTGDLWQQSISPGTVINPYVVEPGQSVTIPVTITPQGKPGSTVTGTIFVDDTSLAAGDVTWALEALSPFPTASDVAAFPYKYTIG